MKNSRLTVAIHILSVLRYFEEYSPGRLVKSHEIAVSVNTSPVVIRRILGALRDAGMVEIKGGASGGASLARSAEDISLCDVYQVMEDEDIFAMHANTPSTVCPIGSNIKPVLSDFYNRLAGTIGNELKQVNINDLYKKMTSEFAADRQEVQ